MWEQKITSLCCNESKQASLIFKIGSAFIWILSVVFYVLGVKNLIIAKDVALPSEFQSNLVDYKANSQVTFVEAERQLLRIMKAQAAGW